MPVRRWMTRMLAIAVGVIGSLVVAEGALWILHFLLRPESRSAELAPGPGERRILCIGDSCTYGVQLDASASYPGRLQSFLDRAAGQPWRVVNLGYPGQNTAQIRGRLAQNLEAYRPEIVCLWAGVNNTWSPAMRHLWDSPGSESPAATLERLVQQIRLLKVARMLLARSRVEPDGRKPVEGQGIVPGLDGAQRGEGLGEVESVAPPNRRERKKMRPSEGEIRRRIRIDLRRILAICREHGARLVVADYPIDGPWMVSVNEEIGRFTRENGLPLVPLHDRVLPLFAPLGQRAMFPHDHATALGNFDIARCFLETLTGAGLIEGRAEWTDLPSASRVASESHVAAVDRRGSKACVEVLSEPSWRCDLAIEGLTPSVATAWLDETGYALIEVELPPDPTGNGWRIRATVSPPPGVDLPIRSPPPITLPGPGP